jgi:hypothetical protein
LYDNLEDSLAPAVVRETQPPYGDGHPPSPREKLALALDMAIRAVKKADWRGPASMVLRVPHGFDVSQRDALLQRWYRHQLRALVPPLLESGSREWERRSPRFGFGR